MDFDDFTFEKRTIKDTGKSQEEKYNKVINFLRRIGYFELIKDDKKYEEFIQKLDYDQFKRILFAFNSLLRNKHTHEVGVSDSVVRVGSMRGARPEIREELLKDVFNSMKKIDNDKERATLTFYQLLRIHMFSDGNGRTSRFMYELLTKQDDFESIKKYFIHENDEQLSTTSYDKSKESFSSVNDIMNESILSDKLGKTYYDYFQEHVDEVPACLKDIRVTALALDSDYCEKSNFKEVNKIIDSFLDDKEKKDLKEYLNDSSIGLMTLSGTILSIINLKKGNLDYIINSDKERFSNSQAFVFNILDPDTFHNWNREDFLLAIKLGDELKKHNINVLNDIFVNDKEYNGVSKDKIILDSKKELEQMMGESNSLKNNNSEIIEKQANM